MKKKIDRKQKTGMRVIKKEVLSLIFAGLHKIASADLDNTF